MSEPQALLLVREQLVRDRREAHERRIARACRRTCAAARPSRWSLLVGRRRNWSHLVGRQTKGEAAPGAAACCTA
jgi:hypothetical protein